jgi:hypothetical protein
LYDLTACASIKEWYKNQFSGMIIFGSVWFLSKKSNQTEFFFLKNQNRFKLTGFDSVRFGFLGQKPVQTGLARFFPVFFRFRLIKPKPNRSVFSGFFSF